MARTWKEHRKIMNMERIWEDYGKILAKSWEQHRKDLGKNMGRSGLLIRIYVLFRFCNTFTNFYK
jgi:hypothetical protein